MSDWKDDRSVALPNVDDPGIRTMEKIRPGVYNWPAQSFLCLNVKIENVENRGI